jgi:hypothetical protein
MKERSTMRHTNPNPEQWHEQWHLLPIPEESGNKARLRRSTVVIIAILAFCMLGIFIAGITTGFLVKM